MHPVMIIIPAAALILGPRAWVNYLLKKHDKDDLDLPLTAGEFARKILDQHQLQGVRVESTDIGDHYDHRAKAVRLARSRFDSRTLTAFTTSAHEVSHALQDASDYSPFVWRTNLAKFAQVTGQVGSILLVAVPLFTMTTRRPFPIHTVGTAIFAVLGTGVIAQIATLPSELDASFGRALPILRRGYLGPNQLNGARHILWACSFTYIAASIVSMLNFWPWFTGLAQPALAGPPSTTLCTRIPRDSKPSARPGPTRQPARAGRFYTTTGNRNKPLACLVHQIGRPLIKCWLRLRADL